MTASIHTYRVDAETEMFEVKYTDNNGKKFSADLHSSFEEAQKQKEFINAQLQVA